MNMTDRVNQEIYVSLDAGSDESSRVVTQASAVPFFANDSLQVSPPSYDECQGLNTPPPSYESLFGRVKEVQKNSNGIFDFFKNVVILLCGTVGFVIMIGVTVIIPILMIVIGSLKMDDCPAGTFIPIYLIVGGCLGVLTNIAYQLHSNVREEEVAQMAWHRKVHFRTLLNFFLTSWFITGCVSVYRIYEPNYYDSSSPQYCNYTLYTFTFWLVTSVFVSAGILSTCLCFISVFTLMLQRYQIPLQDH